MDNHHIGSDYLIPIPEEMQNAWDTYQEALQSLNAEASQRRKDSIRVLQPNKAREELESKWENDPRIQGYRLRLLCREKLHEKLNGQDPRQILGILKDSIAGPGLELIVDAIGIVEVALTALTSSELAKAEAKLLRSRYEALMSAGFTKDQAMQILMKQMDKPYLPNLPSFLSLPLRSRI